MKRNILQSIYMEFRKNSHIKRLRKKQACRREEIIQYIENNLPEYEKKDILDFLHIYNFEMIPYLFREKYDETEIELKYDKDRNLYYTDWHGKQMYWKKNVSPNKIKEAVNNLLIEQDENSPHKYFFRSIQKDTVVADFGAAEGCFVLDIIDKIEKAYLFECDPDWIEALKATFSPWEDKIIIVNKFIGDKDDNTTITIDTFFADAKLDYVKADIEGAETAMLCGGEKTFANKVQTVEVCAYHNPTDEGAIQALLQNYGYECNHSKGYVFFDVAGEPPKHCLRRGIVLGEKNI